MTFNSTRHGLNSALGKSKALIGNRRETDLFISHVGLLNTANNSVHPLSNRAVSIVIIRIHSRTPEASVLLDSVPMLPYGGSAVVYRIEPRGIFVLEEKGIGYVVSSTLGKRGKQIGCAKESSGHSVAEFVNKLAELLGKRFSFLGQTKVKVKDKCQGGLSNALAVLIHHRLLTAQLYLGKG